MKNIHYLFVSALLLSACNPDLVTPDTIAPTLKQVTPVAAAGTDTTPSYTFSSTEAGNITYGGSCSSATTKAVKGNNTVTFNTLAVGSYSNCTIKVKDAKNNQSKALAVTPFDVAVLYTVTVNIPDSFTASRAAGRSANAAASFVVTEIDPATGKVTKEIPINNASQNGDGTWGVNVTTNPNAATVLIVSKNNHAPTVCINCALPQDAVYAPMADTEIQVDVVTTVTLDETIGIPVPMTLDEMVNLMDGVAPLVTGLPAPGTGQTLNEYLDQVAVELETEIDNAFASAETDDDYDSVLDVSDTFPTISLDGRTDTDGDGIPNVCDAACEALGMYGEDLTAPTLAEVTPVDVLTGDTTPSYTFSSSEAGMVTYGGACSSVTTSASSGNNTVSFNSLPAGVYKNCTVRVTDGSGNASAWLAVNNFEIQVGDGITTTDVGGVDEFGSGIAMQSDGKFLVGGRRSNGTDTDFAIIRYNTNGTVDKSFGVDGIATTPFGSSNDYGTSIAVQGDGKILLAGYIDVGTSERSFALARYNSNGSLDISFSSDGMVATPIGTYDLADSVRVQSDGKILIAGRAKISGSDFAVVRYNSNGSLDTSFSGDGIASTHLYNSDFGHDIAIQSDGKIVMAGYVYTVDPDYDVGLLRYNSNGSLDATFSGDGMVITDVGATTKDYAHGINIQSDGKILVAAESNFDFALLRYNSNGSLDVTFNGSGKSVVDIDSSSVDATSTVVVQGDGKYVVVGISDTGGNNDVAVVRYNNDGSLDASFSGDGKVKTAIGSGEDYGSDVLLQGDGKIVVAGSTYNSSGDYDFAILRYNTDGSLDNTFGLAGLSDSDSDGTPDVYDETP